MAGLYDVLCNSGAGITPLQASRVRRVTHGDTILSVNADDEIGVVLNLTEAHRAKSFAEGRLTSAQPRVGAATIIPPGRPTKLLLEGTATVLFLRLPWAELCAGATEHELDVARIEMQPRLAFLDPVLAHWLYAAAGGVGHVDDALRMVVERLLQAHAGRAGRGAAIRRPPVHPAPAGAGPHRG